MTIADIKNAVVQVAPSYPVLSIDLFGSFANGKNAEGSDVDLLVCFDEKVASLFDVSGLKFDIQAKLNTRVDIVAGPLMENSYLTIDKKVRIYEA
ncbi:nucleotidyltransferase domain-containing protein [Anaerotalea alkaliphila]|uniref:Nucleotidyltransferase n=1 Tax=Anaerotalea alkaliphila TaxID=2662126 RepID=A0A7X5KNW4_9FIRM|nr:nucleotidyltransferase [Anaerotalea alkaliphila]